METRLKLGEILSKFCALNEMDYLLLADYSCDFDEIRKTIVCEHDWKSELDNIFTLKIIFCEKGYGILANPENEDKFLTEVTELIKDFSIDNLVKIYDEQSEHHADLDKCIKQFIIYLNENNINLNSKKRDEQTEINFEATNKKQVTVQFSSYLEYVMSQANFDAGEFNKALIKKCSGHIIN